MKTGVVQGGVLSPALFNYYLADFPTPPPNIRLIKYVDDITIYTSGPVVADLINGLNIYLSQVVVVVVDPTPPTCCQQSPAPESCGSQQSLPQVARKGSTLSGFVQRSRLEREVGRDLHSNKWEEV